MFENFEDLNKRFDEVKNKLALICSDKIPDFHGPACSQAYLEKYTSNNYQNQRCLELISEKLLNINENFADFMFFSPLNRVSTIFDIVLRFLGLKVKELHNKTQMEELLLAESLAASQETLALRQKKSKKPKKYKKYEKKDDYAEGSKIVSKAILEKIFKNLYQSLADKSSNSVETTENNNFQIVSQRKIKRPQPQQKTSNVSEDSKPSYQNRSKKDSRQPKQSLKSLNSASSKSDFL